ncbi:hypothetical protein NKG05_00385 [Oerskovia sp. M15]
MTMMARSIGIPARLAVGFLPGDRTSDTVFEVTGRTRTLGPSSTSRTKGGCASSPRRRPGRFGAAWADLCSRRPTFRRPTTVARSPWTPRHRPLRPAPPRARTAPARARGRRRRASTQRAWIIGGSTLVVVLALAALGWFVARRRADDGAVPDVESTWADLTSQLDALEIRWPTSATLRSVPALVVGQVVTRTGRQLSVSPTEALLALASAVEAERYARTWSSPGPDDLAELLDTVVAGVREELSDRPARDDDPSVLPVG